MTAILENVPERHGRMRESMDVERFVFAFREMQDDKGADGGLKERGREDDR